MRRLILELTITFTIALSIGYGVLSLVGYTTETVTAGVTSIVMSQAQAAVK